MSIFDGPFGTVIAFVVLIVTLGVRAWLSHRKGLRVQQWVQEGQAAAAGGDWRKAESAFAAGAKAYPSVAVLHRLHGHALGQLGETTRAEAAYNMAIALEPRVLAHQVNLAFFYLRGSARAKGLAMLKEICAADAEMSRQLQMTGGLRGVLSPEEWAEVFGA